MPEDLQNGFDMEVIEELLLKVERWMILKLAHQGIVKFTVWVNDKLTKLQSMGLFQDPLTLECAETVKLLKMEPSFQKRLSHVHGSSTSLMSHSAHVVH